MMEIQKLRAMKLNELSDELFKLNKELFEMNIKKSTGEIVKPHEVKSVKKNIARVKTVISEIERG
ncbi:MAG: 50S ribosomal protein L29 [Gammaproteobacteria bacterium]|jgi:large subunit ribosomal protein L29|nr:50S ribosomal protein L29 [Pseudomonadota bacterium]